jgi:hypothetical protein
MSEFSLKLSCPPKKKKHSHIKASPSVALKGKILKSKRKPQKINQFTCSHRGVCKTHAWDYSPAGK